MTSLYRFLDLFRIANLKRWNLFAFLFFSFLGSNQNVQSQTTQTFSTPGVFTFTVPNFSGPRNPGDQITVNVQAVIVGAGGGGGRGQGAGGGGGGQVVQINFVANEGDTYSGFIGTGGLGRSGLIDGNGLPGTNTTFNGTTASAGTGGTGGDSGSGGNSGTNNGGLGENNGQRKAGGGGAGASTQGSNGLANDSGTNVSGGDGGAGLLGYGGGGGGSANKQGTGGVLTQGTGTGGGTDGVTGDAADATNGGGGGGGYTKGGNGGNGIVVITYEYARVLPVEYLYFNASLQGERSGILSWATAKEWENSHFEIERAVNDVQSWTVIGQVAGAGYSDSPTKYSYSDKSLPNSGGNVFYRIKQVDFNKSSTYSIIRAIQVDGIKGNGSWVGYPNPSIPGSVVKVELLNPSTYQDERISIKISDVRGVYTSHSVSKPEDVSKTVNSFLENSRTGMYIIQLYWGDQSEQIKLIRK
jgi:hypothetical protein